MARHVLEVWISDAALVALRLDDEVVRVETYEVELLEDVACGNGRRTKLGFFSFPGASLFIDDAHSAADSGEWHLDGVERRACRVAAKRFEDAATEAGLVVDEERNYQWGDSTYRLCRPGVPGFGRVSYSPGTNVDPVDENRS